MRLHQDLNLHHDLNRLHPNRTLTALSALAAALTLSACGGSSDSSTGSNGSGGSSMVSTAGYPQNLAVASPVSHQSLGTVQVNSSHAAQRSMPSVNYQASSVAAIEVDIETILSAPEELASLLDVEGFYRTSVDAQDCYGPTLDYQDHPDALDSNDDGELPSGDLGIWVETLPQDASSGESEACAAAQLNSRMQGIEPRVTASLMVLAAIKAQYDEDGTTDIGDLLPEGISQTDASLAVSDDELTTDYELEFSYDIDGAGTLGTISVELVHYEAADDEYDNEGILHIFVEDQFTGGNCGTGLNDIVRYLSVHYRQTTENQLVLQAREASYCAETTGVFAETASTDNASVSGYVLDPDTAWADNFSVFTAEFDPTPDSEGELEGRFTYVWQAGNGDSHSRILDVGLSIGSGGESWFGFGDRVQTVADASSFGIIEGMICNWAGPGGSHTLQPYAQRQHLTLSTDAGFYIPSNSAASDITYAPTNSCQYEGTGTFIYDRNLDDVLDANDEVAVGPDYADLTLGLDFDLMDVGEGRTDIWETITEDRNFQLPDYP